MTAVTMLSSVPYNQNGMGYPPVPAGTVVNTGAPINRAAFTATVTPPTGWAKLSLRFSTDGVNFPTAREVDVSPAQGTFNSAGNGGGSSQFGSWQYFAADVLEVSPGCVVSLTMNY